MGDAPTICARIGLALDEAMREQSMLSLRAPLQLRRLSRTDSLTGLFNHRIFYERLKDELNRARRYDSPLSVVLLISTTLKRSTKQMVTSSAIISW